MSEVTFSTGDTVWCEEFRENGVVREIARDTGKIGIEFFTYKDWRHELDGRCNMGYGWYCWPSDLKLINGWNAPAEEWTYSPPQPALTEAQTRKGMPVALGVMAYFPDALLEIARVSKAGNDQHNPGQPLHWDRSKSTDQLDCLARHLLDHLANRPTDSDGMRHLAKVAWRALAALQVAIESEKK